MKRARYSFPRSRLSLDENAGGLGLGHEEGKPVYLIHPRGSAYHVVEVELLAVGFLEVFDFPDEVQMFEVLLDRKDQLILADGLGEIVAGPELHRVDGRLDGPVTGQYDDLGSFVRLAYLLEDVQPVHVGKHQVQQHQIGPHGLDHAQSLGSRGARVDPVSFVGQTIGKESVEELVVFNDEY